MRKTTMRRKMPRWVRAPGIDEASFAGAVLTQVVFVAGWWYGTGGCFCSHGGHEWNLLPLETVWMIMDVARFPDENLEWIRALPWGINMMLSMTVSILLWYGVFATVRAGAARLLRGAPMRRAG
jgi:hypothetical protein